MSNVNWRHRELQEAEFKRLYPKTISEQIAEMDAKKAEVKRYNGEVKR